MLPSSKQAKACLIYDERLEIEAHVVEDLDHDDKDGIAMLPSLVVVKEELGWGSESKREDEVPLAQTQAQALQRDLKPVPMADLEICSARLDHHSKVIHPDLNRNR